MTSETTAFPSDLVWKHGRRIILPTGQRQVIVGKDKSNTVRRAYIRVGFDFVDITPEYLMETEQ